MAYSNKRVKTKKKLSSLEVFFEKQKDIALNILMKFLDVKSFLALSIVSKTINDFFINHDILEDLYQTQIIHNHGAALVIINDLRSRFLGEWMKDKIKPKTLFRQFLENYDLYFLKLTLLPIHEHNVGLGWKEFKHQIFYDNTENIRTTLIWKPSFNPAQQNNYALKYAITQGSYNAVDLLLRDGRCGGELLTLEFLTLAIRHNKTKILKLLLSIWGSNIHVHTETLIKRAIEEPRSKSKLFKTLLDHDTINLDIVNKIGIDLTVQFRRPAHLNVILEHNKLDITEDKIIVGVNRGILFFACDCVKLLLEDKRLELKIDGRGTNVLGTDFLRTAIIAESPTLVKILLTYKFVQPDWHDYHCLFRPLMEIAVETKNSKIVKLLLKDGRANPAINNGRPLALAIQKGCHKIVKSLLADERVDTSFLRISDLLACLENSKTISSNHVIKIFKMILKDKSFYLSSDMINTLIHKAVDNYMSNLAKLLVRDPRFTKISIFTNEKENE